MKSVKGDPEKMLRAENLLHPNLQFAIETLNTNGNLSFWIYKLVLTKTGKTTVGGISNQQIQVPY